ncbi:MAG: hypothetical protein K2X93_04135 [Candidatus Obscuribacterales bacterium]|nr:hypothetical protein [Candidatus Obscuribacterales bacterium]
MPYKTSAFLTSFCTLTAAACLTLPAGPAYADRPDKDSPLTVNQQRDLRRAVSYAKKGRADKATPIYNEILSACTDLPKCIAVASYTEQYGFATVDARRAIMEKALEMCRTYDDYILVAMKSRQYECFDVTRKAVQQLISVSETPEQLMDLATKALEVSMTDVAHLAMEKAYTGLDSIPEAIEYSRLAGLMGMVDLQRKVVREMIDDEPSAHELCIILRKIEPMKLKDLNRYLLKKALDQASTVGEFNDIWEAARRHNYKDIFDLAAYRGKKMQLIKRMQSDRAAHQERVDQWKQGNDAAQQRVIKDLQGGGSTPPPSGF